MNYIDISSWIDKIWRKKLYLSLIVISIGCASYLYSNNIKNSKYDAQMIIHLEPKQEYIQDDWSSWTNKVFKEDIAQNVADYINSNAFRMNVCNEVGVDVDYLQQKMRAYKVEDKSDFRVDLLTDDRHLALEILNEILYQLKSQKSIFEEVQDISLSGEVVVNKIDDSVWDALALSAITIIGGIALVITAKEKECDK